MFTIVLKTETTEEGIQLTGNQVAANSKAFVVKFGENKSQLKGTFLSDGGGVPACLVGIEFRKYA